MRFINLLLSNSDVSTIIEPSSHSASLLEKLNLLGQRFLLDGSRRGVTALKTEEAIREEFLLDSLGGLSALLETGRVIDIGTGGGVPGLVLAIARPDLEFVLTDSASKKTSWVKELELKNVEVVTSRLELLGRDESFRAQFDAVTAKALAGLAVLTEFALPLLKMEGRLLAYKGPALSEEIEEARFAFQKLGAVVHRCQAYSLGEKSFVLCEVLKTGPTSELYPRRDGVPQKKLS